MDSVGSLKSKLPKESGVRKQPGTVSLPTNISACPNLLPIDTFAGPNYLPTDIFALLNLLPTGILRLQYRY